MKCKLYISIKRILKNYIVKKFSFLIIRNYKYYSYKISPIKKSCFLYLDSPLLLHQPIPANMKIERITNKISEDIVSPKSHLTFPGREAQTIKTIINIKIFFLS